MKINKKILVQILVALLILSMMPAAVQSIEVVDGITDMSSSPSRHNIYFGETGTFNITVRVYNEMSNRPHTIKFNTNDQNISAYIRHEGGPIVGLFAQEGKIKWTPAYVSLGQSKVYHFEFDVSPQSGATVNKRYRMRTFLYVDEMNIGEGLFDVEMATVVPIPELTTMILVGLGLSGLGLVKKGKKE